MAWAPESGAGHTVGRRCAGGGSAPAAGPTLSYLYSTATGAVVTGSRCPGNRKLFDAGGLEVRSAGVKELPVSRAPTPGTLLEIVARRGRGGGGRPAARSARRGRPLSRGSRPPRAAPRGAAPAARAAGRAPGRGPRLPRRGR